MNLRVAGTLVGYWEQGWEGRIEYAFQPDDSDDTNNSVPMILKNGHELRIFDEDGETVWQGVIDLKKRGWKDRPSGENKVWNDSMQKGVTYQQWLGWFCHQPALKAELLLSVTKVSV